MIASQVSSEIKRVRVGGKERETREEGTKNPHPRETQAKQPTAGDRRSLEVHGISYSPKPQRRVFP